MLREGIRWTVEDINIKSAGTLDPNPDPSITIMSAGALNLHVIESTGVINTVDIIVNFFLFYFFYFYFIFIILLFYIFLHYYYIFFL